MGGCYQCLDFLYAEALFDKGRRKVTGKEKWGKVSYKCDYERNKTTFGCGKAQNKHYISL
jgi:hypothetical protein